MPDIVYDLSSSPTDDPTGTYGTAPGPFALARNRNFGPYLFASLISNCGTWFHSIAAVLLVHELTGSALMVGAVSMSQFAGTLVMAPVAGALADRYDRRHLMAHAQLLSASSAAALALWYGSGRGGVWPVLVGTAVIGLGEGVSVPTKQALVPSLVEQRDLGHALALQSVTFNLARVIGPAASALVVSAYGPPLAFSLNLVSYVPLVVVLRLISTRPLQAGRSDRSLRAGWRFVASDRDVRISLVGLAAASLALDPVTTLSPSLSNAVLGNDRLVGPIVSTFGLGAVIMALAGARRLRQRLGTMAAPSGLVLLGAGLGMAGASMRPAPMLIGFGVAGCGFLLANNALTTIIHSAVPEHLRGRVMAIWAVVLLGSRPFAALVNGGVADLTSPRLALIVPVAVALAVALVLRRHFLLDAGTVERSVTAELIRRQA